MLVFRHCLRSCSYHPNSYYYSALSSLAVIRPTLRVKLSAASVPNTYGNIHYSAAVSVARMSASVAIPQQPHSQHQPASDENTTSAFPTRTSSSSPSRASSQSGRRSRQSTDEKTKAQSGNPRMSAFFPLGYKEAASQWVCSRADDVFLCSHHRILLTFSQI